MQEWRVVFYYHFLPETLNNCKNQRFWMICFHTCSCFLQMPVCLLIPGTLHWKPYLKKCWEVRKGRRTKHWGIKRAYLRKDWWNFLLCKEHFCRDPNATLLGRGSNSALWFSPLQRPLSSQNRSEKTYEWHSLSVHIGWHMETWDESSYQARFRDIPDRFAVRPEPHMVWDASSCCRREHRTK